VPVAAATLFCVAFSPCLRIAAMTASRSTFGGAPRFFSSLSKPSAVVMTDISSGVVTTLVNPRTVTSRPWEGCQWMSTVTGLSLCVTRAAS